MPLKMMFVILIASGLSGCVSATIDKNCSQEIIASPCIDMTDVDTNAVCPENYDPVCGCDKVTYSNECAAIQNGVQHWIEGECCD